MKTFKVLNKTTPSIFCILILTALSLAIGCSKGDDVDTTKSCSNIDDRTIPRTINPIQIGKGELYGAGSENIPKQNIVITNKSDWANLVNAINSNGNISNGFTEVEIDFTCFQIIAVFDDVKPNGGHSIDIIEVIENEGDIVVIIKNILTGDATQVITQPFHIVKIPRSSKPIVF